MSEDLRTLLRDRGLSQDAAGVVGGVDGSTISLIVNGKVRATPRTIVKLAKGLGVGAKRMQRLCDAHWLAAHPDEQLENAS